LPLGKESMDCAMSVYLTDCVPLTELLSEMQRVLVPGGVFLNVGPLIYRGVNPEYWYTPEEILTLAKEYGFECEKEAWSEIPYWQSPHRASARQHRIWTYRLRKISSGKNTQIRNV